MSRRIDKRISKIHGEIGWLLLLRSSHEVGGLELVQQDGDILGDVELWVWLVTDLPLATVDPGLHLAQIMSCDCSLTRYRRVVVRQLSRNPLSVWAVEVAQLALVVAEGGEVGGSLPTPSLLQELPRYLRSFISYLSRKCVCTCL